MTLVRRSLQVGALVGTLIVATVALALITTQTPWFKDWLRRFVVRQSKQYLNGELFIGRLGGNLFTGVELAEVSVQMNGERVIAVKDAGVDYSIFQIISSGLVLDDIRLNRPVIRLRKTAEGWNLAHLVKAQRKEEDREGPKNPMSIGEIGISDATFVIEDETRADGLNAPERIEKVDASLSFAYEPVHYTIDIDHLSLRAVPSPRAAGQASASATKASVPVGTAGASTQPVSLNDLKGKISVFSDNIHLENVSLRTAESNLLVDGYVDKYNTTPSLRLTAKSDKLALNEIARIVPAVAGYNLQPAFTVKANGPADRMRLDLDVRSAAGDVKGIVTADVKSPGRRFEGDVQVARLDLAPILKNPAQRSDITGHAQFDLHVGDREPANNISGTYRFQGPHVEAAGFVADKVTAQGRLDGRRVTVDARAVAYGATATASGAIVRPGPGPANQLAYAFRGQASNVDLRRVPARYRVPELASDLDIASFTVDGRGRSVNAEARLRPSTIEGARIGSGTVGRVDVDAGNVQYQAQGQIANVDPARFGRKLRIAALADPGLTGNLSAKEFTVNGSRTAAGRNVVDAHAVLLPSTVEGAEIADGTTARVNLAGQDLKYEAAGSIAKVDLQRFGRSLKVAALTEPRFAGTLNAETFTVKGSGTTADTVAIDASGVLRDSTLAGGRIGTLQFDTHLAAGTLQGSAKGDFAGFDPAALSGRDNLKGDVNGNLDAKFSVSGIGREVDPASIQANGTVNLQNSNVGGVRVDTAAVSATVQNQIADVREFAINGPAVRATAQGRVALNEREQSNLTYRAEAIDLAEIGKLAGRPMSGAATVEGTVTGNRGTLVANGTLTGSNISYEDNNVLTLRSRFTAQVPQLAFKDATVKAETETAFLNIGGREIKDLTANTTYSPGRLLFAVKAQEGQRAFDTNGVALLHTDHQEVHVQNFSVATEGARWTTTPGSEATIKYGNQTVTLQNVRLTSGDQALSVDGTVGLGETTKGTLDISASNVDLAQIDALALGQQHGLAGRLNAKGRLEGSTKEPQFKGDVGIDNGMVRGYKFEKLASAVGYTRAGLALDARLDQSPGQWLTAKGTMPMTLFRREKTERAEHVVPGPEDRVDLRIESSEINLAMFQAFIPQITNVTGTMQANVHVTGSGRDPHVMGHVDFKNGAFKVPIGNVSYRGLNTRIELREDRVEIPAFQILDDHNHPLSVSGEIATHEGQVGAVNVTVTSEDFEMIDNQLGDVGLDLDVKITGELRRPRIEGSVEVENGRIEVDNVLEEIYDRSFDRMPETPARTGTTRTASTAAEPSQQLSGSPATPRTTPPAEVAAAATPPGRTAAAQAGAEQAEESTGIFDAMAMNVRVTMPDNLVLRGTDLRGKSETPIGLGDMNVTVGGDVTARKSAGGPIALIGTVNTVRGTYDFQGRRFEILRDGRIRFQGEQPINPSFDVTARRLISGVEARVRVRGTVQAPELVLSSNPPLDEADILSLIVFNQPINQLGEGERVSLAARAGAIAGGFVATPLAKEIGQALDLDVFEIQTSGSGGGLDPSVTLGHQVGQRLFVKFSQHFGTQDVSEFILEYQIADFLRLQTSMAPQGSPGRSLTRRVERGGADLIFFFSY